MIYNYVQHGRLEYIKTASLISIIILREFIIDNRSDQVTFIPFH